MLITLTKHETDQHGTDKHRTTLTAMEYRRNHISLERNHRMFSPLVPQENCRQRQRTIRTFRQEVSDPVDFHRQACIYQSSLLSVSVRATTHDVRNVSFYLKFSTTPTRWPLLLDQLLRRPR